MMVFKYPFELGDGDCAEDYMINAEGLGHGHFGVGANRFWHGGLHFCLGFDKPIQAIADGQIVAWRLDSTMRHYTAEDGKTRIPYSCGFVLVKHTYRSQRRNMDDETPPMEWQLYSLYSNLLPKDELTTRKRLPNFLTTQTKRVKTLRLESVKILNDPSQHPFKMCKIACKEGTGWTELKNVDVMRKCLIYPIERLYLRDPAEGIDPQAAVDKIVLPPIDSVFVKAGETLGYAAPMEFMRKANPVLHFEVFSDRKNAGFLSNPTQELLGEIILDADVKLLKQVPSDYTKCERQTYPEGPERDKLVKADKKWLAEQWEPYRKGARFISILDTMANGERPEEADVTGSVPPSPTHTKFIFSDVRWKNALNGYYARIGTVPFHTEADWIRCGWHVLEEHRGYSQDGLCDRETFQSLVYQLYKKDDLRAEPKNARSLFRKLILVHPTEWSKKANEKKYKALKPGLKKLPKLAQEHPAFLEYAEAQQFWEQVPGLPSADEVWHYHPVDFIAHMRKAQRCSIEIPEDRFEVVFREAIYNAALLCEKRLRQLSEWNPSTEASFKRWFGQPDYKELTLFMPFDSKRKVKKGIEKMLEVLKGMKVEHAVRGRMPQHAYAIACAYISDKEHRINICADYTHAGNASSFRGNVETLVHEVSHFKDTAGTHDVCYEERECLQLASNTHPETRVVEQLLTKLYGKTDGYQQRHLALCNAASLHRFLMDGFNEP